MKKNTLAVLNSFSLLFFAFALLSCGDLIDKIDDGTVPVDLKMEIGGKKSEMSSAGFTHFSESNGKRELQISFLSAASLTTINTLTISIPDFKENKSKYLAENGEVEVVYMGDVEIYDDDSAEWKSEKGTVEITSFNDAKVKGKITVTLSTTSLKNKVLEVKNGEFKAEKL